MLSLCVIQLTFKEFQPGLAGYPVSGPVAIQIHGIFCHNLGIKYLYLQTSLKMQTTTSEIKIKIQEMQHFITASEIYKYINTYITSLLLD